MELNKVYNEDCIQGLKKLPDNSVDCCVTSPPYFGLRDYGYKEQIGLESTPELFVEKMVAVFSEVKRVLKPEGTLWLNLGDSYNGSGKGGNPEGSKWKFIPRQEGKMPTAKKMEIEGLKPKDLLGVPWMVAFALRSSGWYLRQDIIWHKPNPMPESVKDRCTKSHEYIFLLSKSSKYFFDAEAIKTKSVRAGEVQEIGFLKGHTIPITDPNYRSKGQQGNTITTAEYANKRSVWAVATKPFKEAHFATFPPDLITPCVLAGCPENGVVLDPFMGAGTTALVALQNNRKYIGFELNKDYIQIAENRIIKHLLADLY